jgi:hypothetical protein
MPEVQRPPVIGGRIILKWILEMGCRAMDWIDLAENKDQYRALENRITIIVFHKMLGNS